LRVVDASAFAYVDADVVANAYADVYVTRSDVDAHPNAFNDVAYADVDAANVDANMPNGACHLARAYASVIAVSVVAVA